MKNLVAWCYFYYYGIIEGCIEKTGSEVKHVGVVFTD